MGRKELVLINLAPASSPCLLTGLLALVLPSRCAPSLQVELVLHFVLVRRGGGCFWTCLLETGQERTKNEKVRLFHKPRQEDLVVYLPVICAALRAFFSSSWCFRSALSLPTRALAAGAPPRARAGQSEVATRERTGRRPKAADAGNSRGRCAARRSDEASQVDWRPLDENLGQRASIFALGGTQPIDFAFAAVAQIALPTAIRFDRSWASRYALTLPCLKAYPKGFLRLARAIAPAHQAPFFPATSHAAKTQIPPAYANEAPARKTLRAPGRGGREASNEPL